MRLKLLNSSKTIPPTLFGYCNTPSTNPRIGKYIQTTYYLHEIARVISYPSWHYGEVQWVFSPPVHCLPTAKATSTLALLSCMSAFKWAERNNSESVYVLMRPEVMCFDMMPMTCFSNTWLVDHSFDKGL